MMSHFKFPASCQKNSAYGTEEVKSFERSCCTCECSIRVLATLYLGDVPCTRTLRVRLRVKLSAMEYPKVYFFLRGGDDWRLVDLVLILAVDIISLGRTLFGHLCYEQYNFLVLHHTE